jgi:hypothetical protein
VPYTSYFFTIASTLSSVKALINLSSIFSELASLATIAAPSGCYPEDEGSHGQICSPRGKTEINPEKARNKARE